MKCPRCDRPLLTWKSKWYIGINDELEIMAPVYKDGISVYDCLPCKILVLDSDNGSPNPST